MAITHMGLEFGEEAPRGVAGGIIEAVLHVQTDGPTRCNPLGAQHIMFVKSRRGDWRTVLGRSTVSGVSELPAGRTSLPIQIKLDEHVYPSYAGQLFSSQHYLFAMHGDVEWPGATPITLWPYQHDELPAPTVSSTAALLGYGDRSGLIQLLSGIGFMVSCFGAIVTLALALALQAPAMWALFGLCALGGVGCVAGLVWAHRVAKSGVGGTIKLEVWPQIACAGQPVRYRVTITPDKPSTLRAGSVTLQSSELLCYRPNTRNARLKQERFDLKATPVELPSAPLIVHEAFVYDGELVIPAGALTTAEVKPGFRVGLRDALHSVGAECAIKLKLEVEGSEPRELSAPIIVVHGTRDARHAQSQQQQAQAHTSAAEVKR